MRGGMGNVNRLQPRGESRQKDAAGMPMLEIRFLPPIEPFRINSLATTVMDEAHAWCD